MEIVTLVALDERTGKILRHPHNKDRYIPPPPPPSPETASGSWATSVSTPGECTASQVRLGFHHRPRNITRGFCFGRDPKLCDICLPKSSVSNLHFSITFNEAAQLCLWDTSTQGTWVSYNGQTTKHPRHHFIWLLPEKDRIEVTIGNNDPLRFVLRVHTHGQDYQAGLKSYLTDRETTVQSLGLTTPRPSRATSPQRHSWYYLGRELGRGIYGKVCEARNVTTGIWYAAKEFFTPDWGKEISILKKLSHVSLTTIWIHESSDIDRSILWNTLISLTLRSLVLQRLPRRTATSSLSTTLCWPEKLPGSANEKPTSGKSRWPTKAK